MFTGLIREVGRLHAVANHAGLTRLDIAAPRTAGTLAIGDSLAVNGICLTVTGIDGEHVAMQASVETRRVTTLAGWRAGDRLNLEPSLRVGDQIGGHFVLGHVDGVGRVVGVARRKSVVQLTVGVPDDLAAGLLPKGSIAVDGVSLTLDSGPFSRHFTVTLIPHTLQETRFPDLKAGDAVNIELDVLAKAALSARGARSEQPAPSRLTLEAILARGWGREG